MENLLHFVGDCDRRIFGLAPAERIRRQRGQEDGPLVVARADAVLSDETLAWLLENRGTVVTTRRETPAAVAVALGDKAAGIELLRQPGSSAVRA